MLVENVDRLVTKDHIGEAIWSGRAISDSVISGAVSAIRKVLGDDGQRQDLIKTVHGRGFRYVGKVSSLGQDAETRAPGRPLLLHVPRFSRLSGDDRTDMLQEIVTEGIVTELTRFRSTLEVTQASDASDGFRLAGSVWHIGQEVKINVQLVDQTNGSHVWAERYSCRIGQLEPTFQSIAATLFGRVMAASHRRALRDDNLGSLLHRATALYNQVSVAAYSDARPLLEDVVRDEPDHLRAHVLLAAIYDMGSWTGWAEDARRAQKMAIEHGRIAVGIDPTDSAARAHLGEALWHARAGSEARLQFERALQLNPNDVSARSLYATYLVSAGEAERALAELEFARKLDPYELNWIPWLRADAYFHLERFEEAIASLQEIVHPINNARCLLVACYAHTGRLQEARSTLDVFISVARLEMADLPETWVEWREFLGREGGNEIDRTLELMIEGLRLAGLDEYLK